MVKFAFKKEVPEAQIKPLDELPLSEPSEPDVSVKPVDGEMVHTCLPALVQVEFPPPVEVTTPP